MPIFKKKNEHFFKRWSPEMAYVLGFFCADGAMTVNPRGARYIDLGITDYDLLKKIRRCFASNHKIKTRLPDSPHQKRHYRLQIGSKIIFKDLLNLGITPRKAIRLKLPRVPRKYFSHFVRGYFDGDGNVWCGLANRKRLTSKLVLQTVFTSSSEGFLKGLARALRAAANIQGFMTFHSRAYRLVYSVRASVSLSKFMYNKAGYLYLERKKRVFKKYLHGVVV